MKRRDFMGALAGLAVPVVVAAEAEAANWVFLGERKAALVADHDRIWVGAGLGQFTKIKLKVRGNALWVYDLDVRYANGGHDDISIREKIPQGGATRNIDIRGVDRRIRYVDFNYGHMPNFRGTAYVQLWARR